MTDQQARHARNGQRRTARVVVASNRAAAGIYPDRTGPIIAQWLAARGFAVEGPVVVPDGDPVGATLQDAAEKGLDLVITTGGTGISPTDRTPEVTAEVVDYHVPGLADAIRRAGLPHVPTAVLSRGTVGVAGRTLIVNLPGRPKAIRENLEVVFPAIPYCIDLIGGPRLETQAAVMKAFRPGEGK